MKSFVALTLLFITAGAFAEPDTTNFHGGRILNGQDAIPHEAPFMIQLARRSDTEEMQNCGASLLNSRWVLTAAHCLTTPDVTVVVAGQHDVRVIEPWEQRRSIERFFIHEDFCGSICPNDIGLIYVNQTFVFDQYVQPIRLPESGQIPSGSGRLFGWGLTTNDLADVLQVADKPILDFVTVCQPSQEGSGYLIDSTNLCAGPWDSSTAACSADSGGPLVQFDDKGDPIVVGIASWGPAPCGTPNVYVRVSAFIEWINRTTALID